MIAGLQKWKVNTAMSDKESFIFKRELNRLYSDCGRCENVKVKEEIVKDITLLTEAILLKLVR